MGHKHENCNCLGNSASSANQNLDEMDFDRSICAAALNRDFERVQELIYKGRINDRDHYGYNALHYATRDGNFKMCKLLIEHGIDVNAGTLSGTTGLHRAAMMGHHDIVNLLLENKACPRLADDSGQTPLHRGIKHLEVVKALIDIDTSLKFLKDHKGNTPYNNLLLDSSSEELKALLDMNS